MNRAPLAVAAIVGAFAGLTACSASPRSPAPEHPVRSAPATRRTPPTTPTATTPTATAPTRRITVSAETLPWRLPARRSRGVALVDGSGFLLAGGLGARDRSTDAVLRAGPGGGPLRAAGRTVEPFHDSAAVLLAGRPTTVGGGGTTELADVQQRDAHGVWHLVGHLPRARSDLAVSPSGRGLLVIGGFDGLQSPTAILSTRDGTHFRRVGRLPSGVRYAGVARQGRTVWVVGGESDGRELDEVWALDVPTGRVRPRGHLPRPVGHEALAVVDGRLLVVGGRTTPGQVTAAMWWFRPGRPGWTSAGHLPRPLADSAWVRDRDRLYLFGGETPDFTAAVTRVGWGR